MNNTEINTSERRAVTTTSSQSTTSTSPSRQAAINGLAIAGFIALVGAAIWLAVYSTRYVPKIVDGIGSAAVALGSVFVPAPTPALSVVPTSTGTTTISFGTSPATSTAVTATTTATTTVPTHPTTPTPAPHPVAGTGSNTTYQITPESSATVYGLPDLKTNIDTIGYLTTDSTDSFVGSGTVPSGKRPAVKFSIKNVGTNWSGTWRFSAKIPTRTSYVFESDPQQSLAPGESIDYILGFDNALHGSSETITITANFDHVLTDANANNDIATADLDIL